MENASKALIIAGAILVSILIIAIGVYIYNSASGVIQGTNMNKEEIQIFNSQWTSYEGRQNGTQVKGLINSLMANAQENWEETGKVPTLNIDANGTGAITINIPGATGDALDNYVTDMNAQYGAVQAKHAYTVKIEMDPQTSLVHKITVKY